MKSRVIFASLILGLGLVANQATAATTIIDDSPVTNKTTNKLLATGTQKQFASYMEQHFSRFAKKGDWQSFLSVVSQYNENPVSVLNFDTEAQNKFNTSASVVTRKLAGDNHAEAAAWQHQADSMTRMINFLWSVQASQSQQTDTE